MWGDANENKTDIWCNYWNIVLSQYCYCLMMKWKWSMCFCLIKEAKLTWCLETYTEFVRKGRNVLNEVKINVRWSWFNSTSLVRILTTVMIESNKLDSSFHLWKEWRKIGCSVIIREISWIIAHINNHMIRDVSLKVLSRNFFEMTYPHKSERSCLNLNVIHNFHYTVMEFIMLLSSLNSFPYRFF